MVLRGATGNPAEVIIDGGRAGRCVYGAGLDAATRIEALTLAGGLPAVGATPDGDFGAGLYVDGGALSVMNCIFTGNESAVGGGAYVKGTGVPTFVGCVFDRNEATETAGLLLRGTCNPIVRDCVFRNGWRTMVGGGLSWVGSGHAQVENCRFEDNTVWETGGGVEVIGSNAQATLRDCVISGNSAGIGGAGLWVSNWGRVVLERCSIEENSADETGAGVFLNGGFLNAVESTILNNVAPDMADGIVTTSSAATLDCCVFAPEAWGGDGTLTVIDDDCGVAGETTGWGDVKAMFRN
ncbi:MAG: right-handed parallel beta-helix repeat-containing protein [bacterium]|nr:right-handed parallel beta-helix repeat-containing protein [bacterium]